MFSRAVIAARLLHGRSTKDITTEHVSATEAAILDKIQYENDVIFVIAGTNKDVTLGDKRIGAPADSINSIVVNSVNSKGEHAAYSRKGLVLSFFNKPDVSSHGGDKASGELIRVCVPDGESFRTGTSFAAPWVTRKIAYLIEVLGLSREVAKALIVDSAAGWSDEILSFKDHLDRVNATDATSLPTESQSRCNAHEANIRQKEIRVESAHNFRLAAQALLSTAIE